MDEDEVAYPFDPTEFYRPSQIINPQWNEGGRVHNWHNHVPYSIQEAWDTLSLEAKLVAAYMAEEVAGAEDWE